jgi:hypothetical protein
MTDAEFPATAKDCARFSAVTREQNAEHIELAAPVPRESCVQGGLCRSVEQAITKKTKTEVQHLGFDI